MTTMLVASRGGHLCEMVALAPRLGVDDSAIWVTNDSPQSRDLLAARHVRYVPYSASRRADVVLWNACRAWSMLRGHAVDRVISTGAGIALSFLPAASRLGAEAHYIDSATRVHGPSLTGRVLRRAPGVHRYAQHPGWGDGWHHVGCVYDGYEPVLQPSARPIRRAVVTLGTWRQDFRPLVERLRELLPDDVETLWQTGSTDVSDLGIQSHAWLPPSELRDALREADLVVSHCGVGASLDALDAGKCAVVVPRRATLGEQVDDHQEQLAAALEARGLAVSATPQGLTRAVLQHATRHRVVRKETPPPLTLFESPNRRRPLYERTGRRARLDARRSVW